MTERSGADRGKNRPLSPSLSSLPVELITQIAGYLDKSSAISLSLAARKFTTPSEPRIWRELNLSLPPYYGELPLVQPHANIGQALYMDWAKAQARIAEERRRTGLKEKAKGLMLDVGRRRLGMVVAVTVTPLPTANLAVLQLLDVLSPNLISLQLDASQKLPWCEEWAPAHREVFDYQLLGCNLAFPNLTHLRVNAQSIRWVEAVQVLCAAAPGLLDLQVDSLNNMCCPSWESDDNRITYDFPTLSSTCLRRLRISFCERVDEQGDEHPFINLIDASPLLQQVSILYEEEPEDIARVIRILSEKQDLRDLHLSFNVYDFRIASDLLDPGFPSLRRLALEDNVYAVLEDLPHDLPSLEIIHINSYLSRGLTYTSLTAFPPPSTVTSFIPNTCHALRTCPRLTGVYSTPFPTGEISFDIFSHLDDIERSGTTRTGYIRSILHGQDELLHARYFTHDFELEDIPITLSGSHHASRRITYTARDGSRRAKIYDRKRVEAAFQEYTDFEGLVVPLEVIDKMRRVDGGRLGDWEGRGIEIGDMGWKVLTDWKEGKEKELAAERANGAK